MLPEKMNSNSSNSNSSSVVKQDLDHQHHSDNSSDPPPPPQQQQQSQRRPRGFAAAAAAAASGGDPNAAIRVKREREREREKERTKLRERHRRSITSRMLAGLRQYGNFPLPARADMNDVLAALAREAGWTVEADGTTYRSSPPPAHLAPVPIRSIENSQSAAPLKNSSVSSSALRVDESLSPVSIESLSVAGKNPKGDKFANTSPINTSECLDPDQVMQDVHLGEHENNFTGNPHIHVYAILPAGIINNFCQLVDPEGLRQELRHLKSLDVDGVVVDCWWGIVEGWSPRRYQWSGYRDLFNIIREFKLKLQVVMAFHECGGNGYGDVPISLPKWVLEIGKDNQDIFFTDRERRRNTECLSWGIDKERVLKGRTGIEVYFDFMRSFRTEFDDLFVEGLISAVEIGLGPFGELKYPSFPERMGWRYPGIGEFQCYDKYLQQNLRTAAKLRGHTYWARGPDNAGQYNSRPHETGFFSERGDYDSYYGRFFLNWYSQTLIEHADNVLSLATLAFEETQIVVKVPAIYWWYRTSSHAAELTAGFYNPTNQDGYSPIFNILKKHSAVLKFVCSGFQSPAPENDEALADSDALSWQVLNSAWDHGLNVAGQNGLPCYDRDAHFRILETARPRNHPDRRHFGFFAYRQPSPALIQREISSLELNHFVKCMHGERTADDL